MAKAPQKIRRTESLPPGKSKINENAEKKERKKKEKKEASARLESSTLQKHDHAPSTPTFHHFAHYT